MKQSHLTLYFMNFFQTDSFSDLKIAIYGIPNFSRIEPWKV